MHQKSAACTGCKWYYFCHLWGDTLNKNLCEEGGFLHYITMKYGEYTALKLWGQCCENITFKINLWDRSLLLFIKMLNQNSFLKHVLCIHSIAFLVWRNIIGLMRSSSCCAQQYACICILPPTTSEHLKCSLWNLVCISCHLRPSQWHI